MKDVFLTSTETMIKCFIHKVAFYGGDRIINLFICKTNKVVAILFLVVEQFVVAFRF